MKTRKPLPMQAQLTIEEIWKILDSDEFYDILPGNGQDDYIISWLKQSLIEAAKGRL